MNHTFNSALKHGYERMAAWSDLLDQINVFPVADADTGRNLKISLAPLRHRPGPSGNSTANSTGNSNGLLIKAATGNSGNIAAAFFDELMKVESAESLPDAIQKGACKARQSVADPQAGTMLDVFDALSQAVGYHHRTPAHWPLTEIIDQLQDTVTNSNETLPVLKLAGVIDAGALGMFLFLEAFLGEICESPSRHRPVMEIFKGKLTTPPAWQPEGSTGHHCISATLKVGGDTNAVRQQLVKVADSVVTNVDSDHLKVHLHTDDRLALRGHLKPLAQVVSWSEERIVTAAKPIKDDRPAIHIMTDAAGSITVDDARDLDITLLNSYLVVDDQVWPETLFAPERLYDAMASGIKVSTAQASRFERRQNYLSAVSRFDRVLYLCVGSVYTGNFETAAAWKAENDPDNKMFIIDTGAASGRLGIAVEAVARFAKRVDDAQTVIDMARTTVEQSREFVFLNQLKFLAAGGRISKTKGFLGDLLGKKPIISPTAHGAAKVAVVRSRNEQLAFGLARLREAFSADDAPRILLQFSDNQEWVSAQAANQIRSVMPFANITVRPLSLTSGAHMGPGTWALAYLPNSDVHTLQQEVE